VIRWSRPYRAWAHASDDDWAGPRCECACIWDIVPCTPSWSRREARECYAKLPRQEYRELAARVREAGIDSGA
jgi:hypothetical protein